MARDWAARAGMTQVAVTGGRGFVGGEVVRQLREQGIEAVVVARPGSAGGGMVGARLTDVEALAAAFAVWARCRGPVRRHQPGTRRRLL